MKTKTPHGVPYKDAEFYYGTHGAYFKRIDFENGYAISIVSHKFSVGGYAGDFEIAVLRADTGEIVYDTSITNDVLGHLDFAEVSAAIAKVNALPKRCFNCNPPVGSPGYNGPKYH